MFLKIFEMIKNATEKIKSDTPQLDAELIMGHVLSVDRIYLYLNRDTILDIENEKKFLKLIERRISGEPVQYITSKQEFMGLDFFVKPGVLIPRNDTEVLVEEVIERIKNFEELTIADVGCGSGAISVALASFLKKAKVYALDIMDIPLTVTKINAENNNCIDRINIVKSDMLKVLIDHEKKVDVVVSNPPYIKDEVIETLMTEVKDYEPYSALSGGEDGLYFYRKITKQAKMLLKSKGLLAFEIGYDQGEAVKDILKKNGFKEIELIKDLGGNDRVVLGWLLNE